MKRFYILCLITGVLFAWLFIQLMFFPEDFIHDLGLTSSDAILVLSRRTAMFMLGIVGLMTASFKITSMEAKQMISLIMGITLLGLATMSAIEYYRESVNQSILVAFAIESMLGLAFGITYIAGTLRKKTIINFK